MKTRRRIAVSVAAASLLLLDIRARAQGTRVVESSPAPNSTIGGPSTAYSVRFDRPIDHVHSVLIIKRGNEIVQTLHPRLQSAPEVLFARAPTLSPGQYKLIWQVKTLTDVGVVEGEIPFTVTSD